MTKEQLIALKKDRLSRLEHSEKSIKCPGALRKARREIRNLEASK